MQIWRIEKFKVKSIAEADYGSFYTGDSYICLNTYEEKETKKLLHDLHFWLGTETTQDEAGTAAYKTVELDTFLKDLPVQHREVEGHESGLFLSYFEKKGGLRIMEGGIESGFNHVEPESYRPRLMWLKGRKYIRTTEVELSATSLCEGDVFVLDAGMNIYVWQGKGCGMNERARAAQLARAIDDERKGLPEVHTFGQDDKDIPSTFWALLGGKKAPQPPQGDDAEWEKTSDKRLFQLSDAGGKLEFNLIATEKRVTRDKLDSKDVFVLDAGNEVFVWVGKGASASEKRNAMPFANQYLVDYKRPNWLPISRLLEGSENEVFTSCFNRAALIKKQPKGPAAHTVVASKAGSGCFLTYTTASNGTLFLNWKHEAVSGALAFFQPGKKVPAFKFKKAGGREELTRSTDNVKKNYFQGWCNYLKMAKEYGGPVSLYTHDVEIYLLSGSKIQKFSPGETVDLAKVDACVAMNKGQAALREVKTVDMSRFLNTGQAHGAALRFPTGKR